MRRIIIGIDPGIADTGYGVIAVEGAKLNCLCYGSIKTPAGQDLPKRLATLYNELDVIIKKYKPQRAAIEKLFFNKNVKSALIVGQARGVAILALINNNLDVSEYTPSQLKQCVTSYGKASKLQVQKMVKLILKLDKLPQPDDAADALALALCALNKKL